MRYNSIPKKTDRAINFFTWENTVRQVKKFMGLQFDPQYFYTQMDDTGTYVSLYPTAASNATSIIGRWTIEKISNTSASVDIGVVNVMGDENPWAKANVTGLVSGDNLIYGVTRRDGFGSITMQSNAGSMPTSSEIGNENFGFAVGNINTTSSVITQYIHSDFNVQYPKEPEADMILYQTIAIREYDENGDLVAIGSETNPLDPGHYYELSVDWLRCS